MDNAARITVARGDGIGPEVMDATLRILDAAGARLDIEEIAVGESVYLAGNPSGISDEAVETVRRNKVLLKAPITTPQGGGYKSLNVTLRKTFGLYANVRPTTAYAPFVATDHPGMDLVVVRENEEDLYAGIEHRQTDDVFQCLKLVSRPGCERIVRYAFEYARANGRRKVTALVKDNIMKMTDGMFHEVFDQVAAEYPDITADSLIVDIGTARIASRPEDFDVIVTLNLYGDIVSDVAAEVAGSVGLAGSANIGDQVAMFEAVHGSAPDIAGRDVANPSGLLLAAVQMLVHLGQADVATLVHNAWLATIEDGVHTGDVYEHGRSNELVGTQAFADAVIERLGRTPQVLAPVEYSAADPVRVAVAEPVRAHKTQLGVDVFVHWWGGTPDELAELLVPHQGPLELAMLSNRGQKVWPHGAPETLCVDHWRCRFMAPDGGTTTASEVVELQRRLVDAGLEPVKTEGLYAFDGVPAFSRGQGQ